MAAGAMARTLEAAIGGEEMEMPLVRRIESGDGIQAWGFDEEGRSGLYQEDEK